MTQRINILELNNVDVYGKRFNGYLLTKFINMHKQYNLTANFIVNHKFSSDPMVIELFSNSELEAFDWQIEEIEQKLNIKNQISISEEALINHPLYKKADILHFRCHYYYSKFIY